jgi:hypothetical protein
MNFFKKPYTWILSASVVILGVVEFIRFQEDGPIREFRRYYNARFIEPLEVVAVTLLIVGIWLAFFSVEIQRRWWRIARWFIGFGILTLGYSLTIPYQGGGFIGFPGMRELMFLWGIIFVCFTLFATVANK